MTKARHPEHAAGGQGECLPREGPGAGGQVQPGRGPGGSRGQRAPGEAERRRTSTTTTTRAGVPSGAGMSAQARLLIRIARSLHCAMVDWGDRLRLDRHGLRLPVRPGRGQLAVEIARLGGRSPRGRERRDTARPERARHFRAGVMKGFARAGRRAAEAAGGTRRRKGPRWHCPEEGIGSLGLPPPVPGQPAACRCGQRAVAPGWPGVWHRRWDLGRTGRGPVRHHRAAGRDKRPCNEQAQAQARRAGHALHWC